MYLFSVKGREGWSLLTSPYVVRRVSRCLKVLSPTLTQYGQCHMELARLKHTHTCPVIASTVSLPLPFTNLSRGTAVHTTLCEVPAVICWICFPSSPCTLAGRVMDPVLWPWPHWPMLLVPHAYTAPPAKNGKCKLETQFSSFDTYVKSTDYLDTCKGLTVR